MYGVDLDVEIREFLRCVTKTCILHLSQMKGGLKCCYAWCSDRMVWVIEEV